MTSSDYPDISYPSDWVIHNRAVAAIKAIRIGLRVKALKRKRTNRDACEHR
jgi:hypothetical protein